jgi:nucleoside-diphosphate-sugar epimerase
MTKQSVFITGSSGCVGHYVVEECLKRPDLELYLLVRDPAKLLFKMDPRIHILQGDLESIHLHKDVLNTMDLMIHLATAWGDSEEATRLNRDKTLEMLSYCDPNRLQKIVYFSTASILGPNNQVIPEAETFGTGYVRSKYRAYHALRNSTWSDKIVTVFPTLVFGGDETHPYSHISSGLKPSLKWAKLLRFFYMDSHFHFLHSRDIAAVSVYALFNDVPSQDVALGNPVMRGKDVIQTICRVFDIPMYFRIKIAPWFLMGLAKLFRIRLAPWDRFCINSPHFRYTTVNPTTFGLPTTFPTLDSVLEDIKARP